MLRGSLVPSSVDHLLLLVLTASPAAEETVTKVWASVLETACRVWCCWRGFAVKASSYGARGARGSWLYSLGQVISPSGLLFVIAPTSKGRFSVVVLFIHSERILMHSVCCRRSSGYRGYSSRESFLPCGPYTAVGQTDN